MEAKPTDRKEFGTVWRKLKQNDSVLKSEAFEINRKIIKDAFDLKKYFNNLIELNPQKHYDYLSGGGDLKLGGIFEIFHDEENSCEIYLKIIAKPNKQIVILGGTQGKNRAMVEFLINTLIFLFIK